MNKLYRTLKAVDYGVYRYIIDPCLYPLMKNLFNVKVVSIQDTAKELVCSHKSLGRFGDGEIAWLLGKNKNSFEKSTHKLSECLLKVLMSNNDNFMIGLPDSIRSLNGFTKTASDFWKTFFVKNGRKFVRYLNHGKCYYNTSVTRPYMDYNTNLIAKQTFEILKKIWCKKNILIVEGSESRLGIGDNLFSNAKLVKRIECPVTNAFESCDHIFKVVDNFLLTHRDYLTLISLGPTATILSYKLCKLGYRAIDIGHIDLEYNWYLMGAKEKINLPYKYVNEVPDGHSALPVYSDKYNSEIVYRVRNKR